MDKYTSFEKRLEEIRTMVEEHDRQMIREDERRRIEKERKTWWWDAFKSVAVPILVGVISSLVSLKGERQKFCVHGIIGARQTGASNEHEHQTQFS